VSEEKKYPRLVCRGFGPSNKNKKKRGVEERGGNGRRHKQNRKNTRGNCGWRRGVLTKVRRGVCAPKKG